MSLNEVARPANYRPALFVLSSLFFMWGFITVLNDILVPHLKAVFDLTYAQAMLIQFVWYLAYFLISLPSAKLLELVGYQRSLVVGLCIMAAGSLGFIPASHFVSFELFLLSLFMLASGVTLLQVAANPYVAVIGPAATAPARLNLVQALNSAGTMVAPLFGSYLILNQSISGSADAGSRALSAAERIADAQSVQMPYLLIAGLLLALALVINWSIKLPDLSTATRRAAREERKRHSLWRHRNLVFGVPAIFIYLIAEIGVGSLFISYVSLPEIGNITAAQAGLYLSLLWTGMMIGRFVGSALMNFIKAETLLAGTSVAAFVVLLISILGSGQIALWALVSVGLFHSIMFPTIFTLGIRGLGPLTEEGSGLLIMAIAGGALAAAQGWIADTYGLRASFWLPAACELYVLFYALWGARVTNALHQEELSR